MRLRGLHAHHLVSPQSDWTALPAVLIATGLAERRLVVLTHPLLRRRWSVALTRACGRAEWITVPSGEASKSLRVVARIYAQLAKLHADRSTVLVALGGGVITDLTGYVAATYLRGIDWIALPTTLVAQLDSAIGGKVGVNLPHGKNLVGAIWPARLVYNNIDTLQSLPAAGWRDGAVEAFKCGLIADRMLVRMMKAGDWRARIAEVITRAVRVKCALVARDLRDTQGRRTLLNLGHTVGHALEVWGDFSRLTHGEAVALGLCAETAFAHAQGWCGRDVVAAVQAGVAALGVAPRWPRWSAAQWARVLTHDKKRVNSTVRLPILTAVGRAAVRDVEIAQFARWLSGNRIAFGDSR